MEPQITISLESYNRLVSAKNDLADHLVKVSLAIREADTIHSVKKYLNEQAEVIRKEFPAAKIPN